jgi:hypothetical protein
MIPDRWITRLNRFRELTGLGHAKQRAHLVVQEAPARTVRLDPFAVDYELRDRSLANVPDQLIRSVGSGFNIDLGIRNLVLLEEFFGFAAITAPWSGIDQHMHPFIIPGTAVFLLPSGNVTCAARGKRRAAALRFLPPALRLLPAFDGSAADDSALPEPS